MNITWVWKSPHFKVAIISIYMIFCDIVAFVLFELAFSKANVSNIFFLGEKKEIQERQKSDQI